MMITGSHSRHSALLLRSGGPNEIAADLLGIHGERLRCFSVPGFEKKLG